MRYDLNGNGDATHADYMAAFPNRDTNTSTRIGCPSGDCTGYELTAGLTFPAATSSPYNPWTPVDQLTGTFDGNGHTLTGMNAADSLRAGLFGYLNSSGLVRDVGLINPTVTRAGDSSGGSGSLVGYIRSGAAVDSSYTTGGSVTIAGGGLAVRNSGVIIAGYAAGAVPPTGAGNWLGGLVGRATGGNFAITNSYSAPSPN